MLRSEKIRQQITDLCKKHLEQGRIKLIKVLISPYYPVVVCETDGHTQYEEDGITLKVRLHHHYCTEIKGLKELWDQWIVFRGVY